MAKIPGLMRRGAAYVYRANVPTDLHETYGTTRQIWRTLKARSDSEAKKEAHELALEFLEEFNAKRMEIAASNASKTPEFQPTEMREKKYSIPTLVKQYIETVLDREESRGEELFNQYLNEPREFKRRVYNLVECSKLLDHHYSADEIRGFEEWIDFLYDGEADRVVAFIERKRLQGRIAQLRRWQAVKDFREFSHLVDPLAPDIAGDQRRPLIRALMTSEIHALSPMAEEPLPLAMEAAPIERPTSTLIPQQPPADMPLLGSLKRNFLADKRRSGTSEGALDEIFKTIDDFIEIVSDKPINTYVKADVREFLGVIQSLPTNSRKKVAYRDLPLREILAKAKNVNDKGPNIATVQKKFDAISGFFKWLVRHYDGMPSNPFMDMRPQERSNVRDERHPFTIEQLNRIFKAPLFEGAQSKSRWLLPGNLILKERGLYWLPFIALYTGMRLGEIMQLTKADVKTEKAITFFDVNADGDKSLKTAASRRRIPIHSVLIDAGLLEYVSGLKTSETRLCWDIPISKRYGDKSGRGSRKMADLLIRSGAKTEKNSFHSFRHNFEDACRAGGLDHGVMAALQGHVRGDMSDRYGHGRYALSILKNSIEKIVYSDFSPPNPNHSMRPDGA